ncbi:MAG: hypothetical protein JW917_11080 [Ignavibacteria bacterium]|nr:hypothetical protein [Ignavibacteria bacterium]
MEGKICVLVTDAENFSLVKKQGNFVSEVIGIDLTFFHNEIRVYNRQE